MSTDRRALVLGISLCAGAMDTATGLLLVTMPARTLALFGAARPGGAADDTAMRFVGAFVAGVGLAYLWGIGSRDWDVRMQRLCGVWGATAVVRACIAVFVISAVVLGRLEPAWVVVGATDALLATIQTAGLRARWLEGNDASACA